MHSVRVVVTGGAGFIGANVCRLLTEQAAEIVVVDDLSTGSAANLDGLPVDFRLGSVTDRDLLFDACAGADSILHLAAVASVPRSIEDPASTTAVNVTGTVNVLDAARRCGAHVVVASSAAVYGDHPAVRKAEALAPRPRSPYAASKLAAEGYAAAYGASYGLPTLAFRFFNVYGPLQPPGHVYAAVVPAFLDAALAGRPLTVHGDGRQARDFVYVGTVAALLADAAARRISSPEPVNLALGGRTTVLELIALLERLVGRRLERRHDAERPGDIRDSAADGTRLRELFPGFEPVPLADGLARTIDWFRSRLRLRQE